MATTETQILDEVIASSRRRIMTMGGTALAGLLLGSAAKAEAQAQAGFTDNDYLNFALNLEYLEAEYYTLATTGKTLAQAGIGVGPGTTATGGGTVTVKPTGAASCKVPFAMPNVASYASELATEEQKHVTYLRGVLGGATVAEPDIDLFNSFNAAAAAAGIGPAFDPFADDVAFLLGSYIFEDVGVTAYHSLASFVTSASNRSAVPGILAVEAYHAGLVRTVLWGLDRATPAAGIAATATKITDLRTKLDGTNNDDVGLQTVQVGLNTGGANFTASTILNAGTEAIIFSRVPDRVIAIVYGNSNRVGGGFYPSRMNGLIR